VSDPKPKVPRVRPDATRVRPVGRGVSRIDWAALDLPRTERAIGAASPVQGIPLPRGEAHELNDDRALERMLRAAHEFGPTGQLEQAGRAGYDLSMARQTHDPLRAVGALAAVGPLFFPGEMGGKPARALTKEALAARIAEMQQRHGLHDLSVFLSGDDLRLANMVVPPERRGQGIGSAVMQELTALADEHGLRATLTPAERGYHGSTSPARLRDFYKRFGFVENKGRTKDFSLSDGMYREPRRGK
jgi:GNAT superfamily N-acetyltransferase